VNLRLEKVKEAVEQRKKLGEKTRELIFSLIAAHEPAGMTTKELVKSTGRDRRTIHGVCKYYQKRGLLEPKTGRYGKYHLTSKATKIDEPDIGSMLVQLHMIRTGLLGLGEIALSSSMDFCDASNLRRLLEDQKKSEIVRNKDSLGKFYLFEFALRLGATLLYTMIMSMKYTNPSLGISESVRHHIISKRFETLTNPMLIKGIFELLLLFLERKLWKEHDVPTTSSPPPPPQPDDDEDHDVTEKLIEEGNEKRKSFNKMLMEERFEEMERIYKETFPVIFESIKNIGYDIVYAPGLAVPEKMEKEDSDQQTRREPTTVNRDK
jgi:hypothetical protein